MNCAIYVCMCTCTASAMQLHCYKTVCQNGRLSRRHILLIEFVFYTLLLDRVAHLNKQLFTFNCALEDSTFSQVIINFFIYILRASY